MSYYERKYSCGHEGYVDIQGKNKAERDWKADKEFLKMCPECFAKQKEEENLKEMEKAKEMGLPELQGTFKQVGWASKIRNEWKEEIEYYQNNMNKFESEWDRWNNCKPNEDIIENLPKIINHLFFKMDKAEWFLTYRNSVFFAMKEVYKELRNEGIIEKRPRKRNK